MNEREDALEALAAFRAQPKFRCIEPEFRHLNPSPREITQPLERALNECAAELALLVKNGASDGKLKSCMAKSLSRTEQPYDTEDREYLAHYYESLSRIVGIRAGFLLNSWLYGLPLALMLRVFGRR